jgi:uncharacterized SAM-dependent methyltransferase
VPVFRLEGEKVRGYREADITKMISMFCEERRLDPSLSYQNHIPTWGGVGFQDIMGLLPYYQTRAEINLLETNIHHILARIQAIKDKRKRIRFWEFGPGNGEKSRRVLMYFDEIGLPFEYYGMDICLDDLNAFEQSIPHNLKASSLVTLVHGDASSYFRNREKQSDQVDVVLDFGGNIGNRGDTLEFLSELKSQLIPGDYYLVGFHTRKPKPGTILTAYNDEEGKTGKFIQNALHQFGHVTKTKVYPEMYEYDPIITEEGVVVMRLIASRTHEICFLEREMHTIHKGDIITVSESKKWNPTVFRRITDAAGFQHMDEWANPHVALHFCKA